jgi:dicarboxylate transporter 10
MPRHRVAIMLQIVPTRLQQCSNVGKLAGVRGLFDGISGTLLRQMSYSLCRFWAYDESKKIVAPGKNPAAWRLALAGSMG